MWLNSDVVIQSLGMCANDFDETVAMQKKLHNFNTFKNKIY